MPKSRPLQESWEEIKNSKLLSAVSGRKPVAIYADGARAWSKAAKELKIPCFQVNHQHKEYASIIHKVPKGLSNISGTRTIDSDWKSLKTWLPKEANKKGKVAGDDVTHSTKLEAFSKLFSD